MRRFLYLIELQDEYDWTKNELNKSLRSIDWDVEDLDETIDILCYFYRFSILNEFIIDIIRTKERFAFV